MSEPHECLRLMEVHRLWEGDLGAVRAGEVRRHLAQCAACRAEVESWNRLSGLLARGDLAQPLAPDRRQQMKETLLERCGAAPQESGDAPGRRSAPVFWPWRWGMPVRVGLALAPLALAGLFWIAADRRVPPAAPVSTATAMPPRPTVSELPPKPPPRPPRIVLNPEPPVLPAPPRLVASRRAEKPPRRSRRIRRAVRMRAAPRERMHKPASKRPIVLTAVPEVERTVPAPGASAAPEPIERIVIQVDEPPVRPVGKETVTHITVIASGDLKAPDATLTVVKTEREGTQP